MKTSSHLWTEVVPTKQENRTKLIGSTLLPNFWNTHIKILWTFHFSNSLMVLVSPFEYQFSSTLNGHYPFEMSKKSRFWWTIIISFIIFWSLVFDFPICVYWRNHKTTKERPYLKGVHQSKGKKFENHLFCLWWTFFKYGPIIVRVLYSRRIREFVLRSKAENGVLMTTGIGT